MIGKISLELLADRAGNVKEVIDSRSSVVKMVRRGSRQVARTTLLGTDLTVA